METVKRVTLNLTFLSFASIPESKCLRSLEMNLDEGVSTSSSPSAFPAASKGDQRSFTTPYILLLTKQLWAFSIDVTHLVQ